jgi:uncharacterized protein YdhG (YjbR/CyaY superfamily)
MELRFKARILQNADMDAAYVEVPYDIKELFGKGRLLVNATFDGAAYRGQVVKMGTPCYIIGVTRQIRKQIGKSFGDVVEVVLRERDKEEIPMWKCPKCGREFAKTEQSHYCGEKPTTIDEYILSQDEDKRADLRTIRQVLRAALPTAEERISWSMPTYWKQHNIIHFTASKKHIGLYPGPAAVEQFSQKLQGYKTDKGTIRIPYGKVDAALIEKIAKWCMETGNHA